MIKKTVKFRAERLHNNSISFFHWFSQMVFLGPRVQTTLILLPISKCPVMTMVKAMSFRNQRTLVPSSRFRTPLTSSLSLPSPRRKQWLHFRFSQNNARFSFRWSLQMWLLLRVWVLVSHQRFIFKFRYYVLFGKIIDLYHNLWEFPKTLKETWMIVLTG